MSNEVTDEQSKVWMDRLNKMSDEQRIIVSSCMRHIHNRAYWGFDNDIASLNYTLKDAEEVFKNEGTGIAVVRHLSKGGFVEVKDFQIALALCVKIMGDKVLTPARMELANKQHKEAILTLSKACEKGEEGIVGFYNTNDSKTITVNGVTHRAYQLNAFDFFGVLGQHGYNVKVEGKVVPSQVAFANIVPFFSKLIKAPSGNSVLVEIVKGK